MPQLKIHAAIIPKAASIGAVLAALILAGSSTVAHAQTPVTMVTSNGTVPNTGGITYTISDPAGTARNIFGAGNSSAGTYTWTSFPEFLALGPAQTMTVTFSAPVSVSDLVFGVNSYSHSTAVLTISGGTASLGDFNISEGLVGTGAAGLATFSSATGDLTSAGQDFSVLVGSTSSDTITSYSIAAAPSSNNGVPDGYTVFAGFKSVSAGAAPEPGSVALLLSGGVTVTGVVIRRRKHGGRC